MSATQAANNMTAFAPADRIEITPEYLAGRRAREEGKGLGANPYRLSELGDRMTWFLGYYDFAHGVSVERRAKFGWQDDTDAPAWFIEAATRG
jgi:hypothetical protein